MQVMADEEPVYLTRDGEIDADEFGNPIVLRERGRVREGRDRLDLPYITEFWLRSNYEPYDHDKLGTPLDQRTPPLRIPQMSARTLIINEFGREIVEAIDRDLWVKLEGGWMPIITPELPEMPAHPTERQARETIKRGLDLLEEEIRNLPIRDVDRHGPGGNTPPGPVGEEGMSLPILRADRDNALSTLSEVRRGILAGDKLSSILPAWAKLRKWIIDLTEATMKIVAQEALRKAVDHAPQLYALFGTGTTIGNWIETWLH